jgi:hypothetical protein
MKRSFVGIGAIVALWLGESVNQAQQPSCECTTECTPIATVVPEQTRVVEQTIMVPRVVTQKQRIQVQEVQMQEQSKVVTVYDQVPEVVNVPYQETVVTQETRLQPQTTTTYRAVARQVQTPVSVAVQRLENQTVAQQVVRNQAVRVTRNVTTYQVLRTWVPGQGYVTQPYGTPVTQQVVQDEMRPVTCTESCVVQTPVTRMETQMQTQQVLEYQPVTQTVNVPVTVAVPRVQTRTQQVVQYRTVPRQVVQKEMISVPVSVEKEIDVPVTQYFPQTIQTVVRCAEAPAPVVRSQTSAACPTDCLLPR